MGEYELCVVSVIAIPLGDERFLGIQNGFRAQMCLLVQIPCVPTLSAVHPSASSRPRLSWEEQIPISA